MAKQSTKKRFDYKKLRYSGEVEAVRVLEEEYALNNYYDIFDEEDDVLENTKRMVSDAVQMNELLAPRLYNICKEVKYILSFDEDIDFYIAASSEVNAFSINGFGFAPHIICLTSSLINLVTDDELRFIIGHEIGHLIYKHSKLDVIWKIIYDREDFSGLLSLTYNFYRWYKYAEISADRVGYLVCPDHKVIGKLFLKFAAGLSEDVLNFDVNEYLKQLDRLLEISTGDFMASHPNNMIRIKNLILFSESTLVDKVEKGKTRKSKKKLEEEVTGYLDYLEIHPHKELGKMIVKYLSVAGIYIAHTEDGIAYDKTGILIEELYAFTSQPETYLLYKSLKDIKNVINECSKFFAGRHDTIKYMLLDKIIRLAISDGRMEKEEKEKIYELGKKLRISQYEVIESIKRASEEFLVPQKRRVERKLV